MLRACSLLFLAGCHLAFGLERAGVDGDGDGTPDDHDPCPHLADESATDADGDGISADCDADDAATSQHLWLTFPGGQRGSELALAEGDATPDAEANAIVVGSLEDRTALVLDVDTGTALIDLQFEIVENAIEDSTLQVPWAELGIFTAHREFDPDNKERGTNCFVGRDAPPLAGYLQFNEDEESRSPSPKFDAPLTGLAGRMRHHRTADRVNCSVIRAVGAETSGGFAIQDTGSLTGKIAITAHRLRARLVSVWISYQ